MKLSAHIMVLPRKEVFFLEEWINHHLDLGFDKIYVYDNGLITSEDTIGEGKPISEETAKNISKGIWDKKPNEEYSLDISDEEIYNEFNNIINKYDDNQVELISWKYKLDHNYKFPLSHQLAYKHCVENNKSDWWISIDPDEYVILYKHNNVKDLIQETSMPSIRLKQRVFETRKKGQPVRQIFKYAMDLNLSKTFVKSPVNFAITDRKLKIGGSILSKACGQDCHSTRSRYKGQTYVDEKIARLHHYRGHPKYLKGGEYWGKYLDSKFDKIDKSMEKYIN